MRWFWPLLAVLALWGGIAIVRRARERAEDPMRAARRAASARDDDGIDREVLEEAEREVKDLRQDHAGRSPAADEPPDDWGPGSPKRPYA